MSSNSDGLSACAPPPKFDMNSMVCYGVGTIKGERVEERRSGGVMEGCEQEADEEKKEETL